MTSTQAEPRDLGELRAMAAGLSLQQQPSLAAAVGQLRFVQFDPIRQPARAQDLILWQRVAGYHAGDLETAYEALALEEGHLHVYGVMPPEVMALLTACNESEATPEPGGFEAEVLAAVRQHGRLDPRQARSLLGESRVTNAWGGVSAASTRALEELHLRGHLRVAGRRNGLKVYAPASSPPAAIDPAERLRRLTLVLARLLAPVPEASLRQALQMVRYHVKLPGSHGVIEGMLRSGELSGCSVDGLAYVWPGEVGAEATTGVPGEQELRLLAPFDPLVWDRRRFEHLWGWQFRLGAYTPRDRRPFGYYALPMLWRDEVIGWANCTADGRDSFTVTATLVNGEPLSRQLKRALGHEVARLQAMTGRRMTLAE